jgi:hypothetical protein
MLLDLTKTTFYIINLVEDREKKMYLSGQMTEMGFPHVFVPAVRTSPGSTGITLSHLKVLSNKDIKVPFVVLEDDCRFVFDRIEGKLDLPDDTDGFYLGHSSFGMLEGTPPYWGEVKEGHARYDIHDDRYLRIKSMLSLHALIYISESLRQRAINANWKALLHFDWYSSGDMGYPEIQPEHLLLSPYQPWCYQSEIFGGNWPATKGSLLEKCPITKT